MSKLLYACAASAAPIDLDTLRQRRLERSGLLTATARAVAVLAYGEPRDNVLVVSVVEISSLTSVGVR